MDFVRCIRMVVSRGIRKVRKIN